MEIASIIPNSRANGPGTRFVIWTQGCDREPKCQGCFNTELWSFDGGMSVSVDTLILIIKDAMAKYELDGISISGGEPLAQPDIKAFIHDSPLPVLLFTGREYLPGNIKPDMAVVGPYKEELKVDEPLRGSSNQKLIGIDNTDCIPKGEILIKNGEVSITGVIEGGLS